MRRADELLGRLALAGGEHTALRRLSKGNAQKVALAQAVLVRPELLVLDEPWSGLDAFVHDVLADLIREVADGGGAVVFTDHRASVVRANASTIYEIGAGRLRQVAAVATRAESAAEVVVSPGGEGPPLDVDWSAFAGVTEVARHGTTVTVRVAGERCDALLLAVIHGGWSVISVRRTTAAGTPGRDEEIR